MAQLLLPFLLGLVAGALLLTPVRRIGVGLGLVDRPDGRKIHQVPVPRIGGVAIYLGGFIGAMPFLANDPRTTGLLLAATCVFVVGLLDDVLDLPPKVKLAGQLLGCLILLAWNIRIDFVTDFLSGAGLIALGWLSVPLTVLWVIGLTNTVNLVDGVDGLAGGIVLIALTTLLAVRLASPSVQDPLAMRNVMVITAALSGSLLAFLRLNVHPASIFMGDSGAYFLGFTTAALSVAGAAKGSIVLALIVPVTAFGLPIIDVLFAIVRRRLAQRPIFQADRGHLHHRLLSLGFNQRDTTRFLWLVSGCFGLLALLVSGIPHRGAAWLLGSLLALLVASSVAFFLDRRQRHRRRGGTARPPGTADIAASPPRPPAPAGHADSDDPAGPAGSHDPNERPRPGPPPA